MVYVNGVELKEGSLVTELEDFLARLSLSTKPQLCCWINWNTVQHTEDSSDAVRLYRHLMSITPDKWWTTSLGLLVLHEEHLSVIRFGDDLPLGDGEAEADLALKYAILTDKKRWKVKTFACADVQVAYKNNSLWLESPLNIGSVGVADTGLGANATQKSVARTINGTLQLAEPEDVLQRMLTGAAFAAAELRQLGSARGFTEEFLEGYKQQSSQQRAVVARRLVTLDAPILDSAVAEGLAESAADEAMGSRGYYWLSVASAFVFFSSMVYFNTIDAGNLPLLLILLSLVAWGIAFSLGRLVRVAQWYRLLQSDRAAVKTGTQVWDSPGLADAYQRQGRRVRWCTFAVALVVAYMTISDGAYHHSALSAYDSRQEVLAFAANSASNSPAVDQIRFIEWLSDGQSRHIEGMFIAADDYNRGLLSRNTRRVIKYFDGQTYQGRVVECTRLTYWGSESSFVQVLVDLYAKPVLYKFGYDYYTVEVGGQPVAVTCKVGPFVKVGVPPR